MSLHDAMVIIAHRKRFNHLDAALALVGAKLAEDVPAPTPTPLSSRLDGADLYKEMADGLVEVVGQWSAADVPSSAELNPDEPSLHPLGGDRPPRPSVAKRRGAQAQRSKKGLGVIAGVLDVASDPMSGTVSPTPSSSYSKVPLAISVDPEPKSRTAFRARTLATTLHGAVRIWKEGTEPDVDATIERIARAEAVARVPTVSRLGQPDQILVLCELTLRFGPYRDDVRYLLHTLRRQFGEDRLQFMSFRGSPALGCGSGPVWTWKPYKAHQVLPMTLVVATGVATRAGDPNDIHSFAMQLVMSGRPISTVLVGATSDTPKSRPYPQILVQD